MAYFLFYRYTFFYVYIIIPKIVLIIFCFRCLLDIYFAYQSFEFIRFIVQSIFGTITWNRLLSEFVWIKWNDFSDKYIIITNVVLIIFFPLYHLHLFQILIIQSHKLHYLNILITITTSAFAWSKTRYLYILGQKYKAKKKLIKCILLRLHKFKALMLS